MPYIYTLAGKTYHDDYTIMRGLVMDFPKDTALRNIGDQFMFGPVLLINPVYNYKAKEKNVYLPAGTGWFDLYSGKYFNGGKRVTVDAPYERMPVFVKEGSIIPFGPEIAVYLRETCGYNYFICLHWQECFLHVIRR